MIRHKELEWMPQGPAAMGQWLNPHFAMCAVVHDPAVPLPIQLIVYGLGKQ